MRKPELTDFFTHDQPLGPINSSTIKSRNVMKHLFSTENLIYREMGHRPSAIIGRRGAGKTAALRSVYLSDDYDIIIELEAHKAFREIIDSIAEIATGAVFPEEVAELWNTMFWHTVLPAIAKQASGPSGREVDAVKRYVSGMGIGAMQSPYRVMRKVVRILKDRGGDKPIGMLGEFLEEEVFDDVTFIEARSRAIEFMDQNNLRAIILLDTLDDFQLEDTAMHHAISGLLKCQGEFRFPGSPCELRCCIPSEIFHQISEVSSNPIKDFQQQLMVHWHAGELIQIAARRYLEYLQLYYPDLHAEFDHLDSSKRSDARTFWQAILPARVENKLGIVEGTIAYILRHTQLLPRHLLTYLNSIARITRRNGGHPGQFTYDAVVEGIHQTENTICAGIFSAFRYAYPGAKQACERCLPYLPLHFEDSELHKAYIRRGKGIPNIFDYDDFKRMLIEIGAIGRATKTTRRYVEGVFEYIVPHKLIVSSADALCIHPLFCEIFSVVKPEKEANPRVIYPYGTDTDAEEFRQLN